MSCYIDADGDHPITFSEKDRKARKQHTCGECNRTIEPGETYRYESGIWPEGPESHKTCMDCLSVREAFFCSHIYGQMWEDMHELVLDYDGQLSGKKMLSLTPAARAMVCDIIEALEDD